LLEVDSVDVSSLAATTHYHSDKAFVSGSGDTPASTQYLPNLLISDLEVYRQAISLDGSTGGSTESDSEITVRLARYLGSDEVDRLTEYDGEELFGQTARLLAVGTLPDGTVTTLASPRILVSGTVSDWLRGHDDMEIKITRKQSGVKNLMPTKRLLGYRDGLYFDGSTSYVDTGLAWTPTSFTIMVRMMAIRNIPASPEFLVSNGGSSSDTVLHFYYSDNGYVAARLPSLDTIISPTFGDDDYGVFNWAVIQFDESTETARCWLNGEYNDEGWGVPLSWSATTNWYIGADVAESFRFFDGAISCVAFFDSFLDEDTVLTYQRSRLTGEEDNLVLFYPGENLSTTLYDYAIANDPPLDGTIAGSGSSISTGEGDPEVAGNLLPVVIGRFKNALGIPVDPTVQLYRFAASCQEITEVRDRGAPYTITATYDNFDTFSAASPTAGNAVVYVPMALVKVGGTLSDQAVITADGLGESLFSYGLQTDGAVYTTCGTGLAAVPQGPFSVEFDLCLTALPSSTHLPIMGDYNAGSRGFMVSVIDDSSHRSGIYVRTCNAKPAVDSYYFDRAVNLFEPARFSVVVSESGSTVTVELYKNGVLFGTEDNSGEGLLRNTSSTIALTFGAEYTGAAFTKFLDNASFGTFRLWSKALSESEVRQYMFENPDPATSGLAGMWVGSDYDTTTVPDEVSTNDGAFVGTPTWVGGLSNGSPLAAAVSLLSRYASIDVADIEVAESAWDSSQRGADLLIDQEGTVESYVSLVLASIGGWAVSPPSDYDIRLGATLNPDSLTSSKTILAHEVLSVERLRTVAPPQTWNVGYGPNWHVQTGVELVASVSGSDRSFYSKEIRLASSRAKKNDVRYPPAGRESSPGGLWTARRGAALQAASLKSLYRLRPELQRVTLLHALTGIVPGDVASLTHDDLDSSGSNYLVLAVTTVIGDEGGDILDVWRPG